jgi:acetoacetate decarboxylase
MNNRGSKVRGMYSNKVGLMWPQSPRGIASLMDINTESTLVSTADNLIIGWETDPEVVREYVPEPLEVDGTGRMYLITCDRWGFSSRSAKEFVSAERANQTESFFCMPCTYKGEEYVWNPFSWGNRDWLAIAGRQIGLPHKWAKVQMTRFHPFHPTYKGPHKGARICVTVENVGLVLRATADLKRKATQKDMPWHWTNAFAPRFIGHRYVYDSCKGKPVLNDLVVHIADNCELSQIWYGDGWVKFYEAENEEVEQFQPKRMIGAWWYSIHYNHQITPPYVIHDYGETTPYANRPRIRELLNG